MSSFVVRGFDPSRIMDEVQKQMSINRRKLKTEIAKDTNSFVPFNKGYLRRSVNDSLREDDNLLIYNSPYAHFQYEGKVMISEKSHSTWAKKYERKIYNGSKLKYRGNGQEQWFEVAKRQYMNKWLSFMANLGK